MPRTLSIKRKVLGTTAIAAVTIAVGLGAAAAATRPAYSPWLGRFEDWILTSDLSGIIARSASKNVLLFPLDGYTANAAWPAGMHLLPAAS